MLEYCTLDNLPPSRVRRRLQAKAMCMFGIVGRRRMQLNKRPTPTSRR
jgi:hypothetical protein